MDIQYIAGFFDGEGCIRIDRLIVPSSKSRPSGYTRYQLKVSIAQANPLPLQIIMEQFSGTIVADNYAKKKMPNAKTRHSWVAWSRYAYDFLIAVRPYLLVKAEEADLAIAFFEEMDSNRTHFRKHRGNPPDKDLIHLRRDEIVQKLGELKNRDFSPINSGPY